MNQSLNTTTTCFTISANNIILDGNGFNISGDSGSGDYGVLVLAVTNATIKNMNISTFDGGVTVSTGGNHLIENNSFYSNLDSIIFNTAGTNRAVNNSIFNSSGNGIKFQASSSNTVEGGVIDESKQDAILFSTGASDNNNITNVIITNTNSSHYDLKWDTANIDNTWLIDMPQILNYTFTGIGGTLGIKNSNYGSIRFLSKVNGTGTNLTDTVKITNNSMFVNSTLYLLFNRSSEINIYNNPFALSKILRDDIECPATICANLTSLNSTTVVFNITHWTTYSLGEEIIEVISPPSSSGGANYPTSYEENTSVSLISNVTNEEIKKIKQQEMNLFLLAIASFIIIGFTTMMIILAMLTTHKKTQKSATVGVF